MRRSLQALGILALCAIAVWLSAERPALKIVVEQGGHAFVKGRFSQVPLPETVFVRANGSHTVIRIVNRDSIRHQLGLFDAEPGATRDFIVSFPGTFGGFCSAHPLSKQLVYVVE